MSRKIGLASPIPQFELYGETEISHKPEFAHITDIRSRGPRNRWFIKPHRHPHFFQVLCVFSGAADVQLDTTNSRRNGCSITIIPPGVVHGFKFRPGTRGALLSLAVGIPEFDAENQIGLLLEHSVSKARVFSLDKDSSLFEDLCNFLELISRELVSPLGNQKLVLLSLIKLVLLTLSRMLSHEDTDDPVYANDSQLFSRYRALQEVHYRDHWKIIDYAVELGVSVSTLNRACQVALGRTAKKLIQERVHIEAKRRLIYTQESLSYISHDLGFKNAAYFSKAFKSLEGVAPHTYRMNAYAITQAALNRR